MESAALRQLRKNVKTIHAERLAKIKEEKEAKREIYGYFLGRMLILENKNLVTFKESNIYWNTYQTKDFEMALSTTTGLIECFVDKNLKNDLNMSSYRINLKSLRALTRKLSHPSFKYIDEIYRILYE
jgi:hypothetical protein